MLADLQLDVTVHHIVYQSPSDWPMTRYLNGIEDFHANSPVLNSVRKYRAGFATRNPARFGLLFFLNGFFRFIANSMT